MSWSGCGRSLLFCSGLFIGNVRRKRLSISFSRMVVLFEGVSKGRSSAIRFIGRLRGLGGLGGLSGLGAFLLAGEHALEGTLQLINCIKS